MAGGHIGRAVSPSVCLGPTRTPLTDILRQQRRVRAITLLINTTTYSSNYQHNISVTILLTRLHAVIESFRTGHGIHGRQERSVIAGSRSICLYDVVKHFVKDQRREDSGRDTARTKAMWRVSMSGRDVFDAGR